MHDAPSVRCQAPRSGRSGAPPEPAPRSGLYRSHVGGIRFKGAKIFSLGVSPNLSRATKILLTSAIVVGLMTVSTLITHIEIETPYMQYAMWTLNRSIDPRVGHVQNIFSIQSPGLGIIAVTIGMTLHALLVLSSASLFGDAYRRSE